MLYWQKSLLIILGCFNLLIFLKGWYESVKKGNPYGKAVHLGWLGMFVWGDAIIFGPFWFLTSLVTLLLQDWILFCLIISIFWLIRSAAEAIYWLNEQFSTVRRNPPETLAGHRFLKNDSIWFIYQIYWQCIVVISVITTIYLTHIWLLNRL